MKHGKPCKCGMLAGPLGCAAVKSGHVKRFWDGVQEWWSSSLGVVRDLVCLVVVEIVGFAYQVWLHEGEWRIRVVHIGGL